MSVTATQADRTADELAAVDRQRIIHPYLPSSTDERVVMVDGDGCRLRDVEGREYLDATGGLWLAQIGHGRREIAAAAAEQMQRLEYFTSFWEFSNDRAIELAERLTTLSPPRQTRVYFTSGGSEGNEAALKLSRFAHSRRGDGDRTWILARRQAYHGVGYGSGTVTGFPVYHEGFGPMLPHVRHLTPPWPYRAELFDGDDPTEFCIRELENAIDELGADRIAAFIGEPVMGVAGMLVPPDDYWPRVQALLREHGITFIFDEVVSAYGRIGRWFAAEHFGVEPDIIVTAKGITSGYAPLGAVLVSEEIAEAVTQEGFPMGFTYNGHPTSCAVALANLGVIESEGLLDRARETGAYILERLGELTALPIVGEVRGVGMMHAVELVADRETRAPLPMDGAPQDVIRRETGVIVRDCQHNLVISPPLIMSREEADEVIEAMRSVLERTDASGRIGPRE
ncbi:MAG: aminotransferase class III-fold pyridoxal phosphate-dependent enzyme [Solirubrobacterales bacterium]|nr:aminotransferase class III-fold pyridoxal phosphate-dependent enzyme [Solirubrobacterales bacterium]